MIAAFLRLEMAGQMIVDLTQLVHKIGAQMPFLMQLHQVPGNVHRAGRHSGHKFGQVRFPVINVGIVLPDSQGAGGRAGDHYLVAAVDPAG